MTWFQILSQKIFFFFGGGLKIRQMHHGLAHLQVVVVGQVSYAHVLPNGGLRFPCHVIVLTERGY